jgi:hypothetical protein
MLATEALFDRLAAGRDVRVPGVLHLELGNPAVGGDLSSPTAVRTPAAGAAHALLRRQFRREHRPDVASPACGRRVGE